MRRWVQSKELGAEQMRRRPIPGRIRPVVWCATRGSELTLREQVISPGEPLGRGLATIGEAASRAD
ncbi:hypothetical protein GCM10009661_71260 [Catellatospora chokoriensis]|uniref:Uncharacterized protein n=1 Tax=Catellatospora chokoriensis TaxID=310353 RepID=A0A8J3JLY1_9ACTN|nr:hypothetical protein Cch02nite_07460 [Catellatospora chokoriensis]